MKPGTRTIAGVDGCKSGWVAAILDSGHVEPRQAVFGRFAELLGALPDDAVIAVDMPMGLPEHTGRGGRGPEALVRPFLGRRRSSVFSVPSRAAVYSQTPEGLDWEKVLEAHRQASMAARTTSDPPRGVSIQAFFLFPKIREIDTLLRSDPMLSNRVIESHPELAFWKLNGNCPMDKPKKIKSRINADGMAERKALLEVHCFDLGILETALPRGVGADDWLDACVLLLVAGRYLRGEAISFPDPPFEDAHGIPVAIRV